MEEVVDGGDCEAMLASVSTGAEKVAAIKQDLKAFAAASKKPK